MPNPGPHQLARDRIDVSLVQCGWTIQDKRTNNLYASHGIAIREYQIDFDLADSILFIDKKPVGVIEAKRPVCSSLVVMKMMSNMFSYLECADHQCNSVKKKFNFEQKLSISDGQQGRSIKRMDLFTRGDYY